MAYNLWITYAWMDNADGDFDYLVGELARAGVSTRFDRVALVPGQRLWDQIAGQIEAADLSAWAYLLTPASLDSEPCREELGYALQRALSSRGDKFPLIGMIHGLSIADVPSSLRIRLCVSLASPDWIEQVKAGVENRAPVVPVSNQPNFKITTHRPYLGDPSKVAVEITARFGEIRYWRIGYPRSGPKLVGFGTGPAGGFGVSTMQQDSVEGTFDFKGVPMHFRGAGVAISASTSAYAVFKGGVPSTMAFGWAKEAFGIPDLWWPMAAT